jgi:hypothetical protein
VFAPESVDERFDGNDTIRLQEQTSEEGAGLARRKRDEAPTLGRFERPEQSEFRHRRPGIIAG